MDKKFRSFHVLIQHFGSCASERVLCAWPQGTNPTGSPLLPAAVHWTCHDSWTCLSHLPWAASPSTMWHFRTFMENGISLGAKKIENSHMHRGFHGKCIWWKSRCGFHNYLHQHKLIFYLYFPCTFIVQQDSGWFHTFVLIDPWSYLLIQLRHHLAKKQPMT